MPVPASINDLSTTAGSNSPAGSEGPQEGDNYIRALSSFIAILRDLTNGTTTGVTIRSGTFSGTMAGAAAWAGLQTFQAGISATDGTFSGDLTVGDDLLVSGDLSLATGQIVPGDYTPTVSNKGNCSLVTTNAAITMRIGNRMLVTGQIGIDVDSAGAISFQLSLPVASNLSAATQLAGSAGTGDVTAMIQGNTTNDTAQFNWTDVAAVTRLFGYTFMYRII